VKKEKDEVDQSEKPTAMVSRRKILSRSRDDLNVDFAPIVAREIEEDEEDVWYHKDKLYRVSVCYEAEVVSVTRDVFTLPRPSSNELDIFIWTSSCSRRGPLDRGKNILMLLS